MYIWRSQLNTREWKREKYAEFVYSIVFTWYSYQSVWTPTISHIPIEGSLWIMSKLAIITSYYFMLNVSRFIVWYGCQWSWTDFILLDGTVKVLSINGYSRQICETSPWGLIKKAASPILPNFPFPWSHRPAAFFRFFPSTVYFCDFYISLRAANKVSQHLCYKNSERDFTFIYFSIIPVYQSRLSQIYISQA